MVGIDVGAHVGEEVRSVTCFGDRGFETGEFTAVV